MHAKWIACACVLALAAAVAPQNAGAQNNGDNGSPQENPTLKTRPQQEEPAPAQPQDTQAYNQSAVPLPQGPPNAIPEGTRFLIKLHDTLDTSNLEQGKRFKAELSEDLIAPNGLIIPKGCVVKGHVATFERGYTGARMMLAMDEIETHQGSAPLIATVTGVPGDPSIKSTGQEGELAEKGPDKRRLITNAAIGAGVGAAAGAAAGGAKGAAAGAVAGAGIGTGSSFLFKPTDMKLLQGMHLEVRLDRDLAVPSR